MFHVKHKKKKKGDNVRRYIKGCLPDGEKEKTYRSKGDLYNDTIICFDIETTSAWMIDGVLSPFDYTKPKEFYKDRPAWALCYIWQCSIEDKVYYGRELSEFSDFMEELQQKYKGKLVIWVHNLSYEFVFLENILTWEKIFARKPHKVMYAEYENITFRCTYFLTRLSLANWAINRRLPVKKLKGNLAYNVVRTPKTMLSSKEMSYSENDVLVMFYGLKEYIAKYGHLKNIPLTQTGEVRRALKNVLAKEWGVHKMYASLLPRNYDEYAILNMIKGGGDTHANYSKVGQVRKWVRSKDISSSYPAVMIAKKYPMSKWYRCTNSYQQFLHNDDYSLILDIEFVDIESIHFCNYIMSSKCKKGSLEDPVYDNGRISKAKRLRITITNIDFEIIEKTYTWNKKKTIVHNAWQSVNEYLPKPVVEFILEMYEAKTTLKGTELYSAYMDAKERLNSVYGMMVTAIIMESVLYAMETGEWKVDHLSPDQINAKLDELRNKPYKVSTVFAHGCFITAYARQALWSTIIPIGYDVNYYDTDSNKYENDHEAVFEAYNRKIVAELDKACEYHGIDKERTRPLDRKGKPHQIGVYEDEGVYSEFVTLGAKRYAFRKHGKLGITVSGVNPSKGVVQLKNDISNFKENLVFEYQNSGKMIMQYYCDAPPVTFNKGMYDEYTTHDKHGIIGMPTTYNMSMTQDYLDLITFNEFSSNFNEDDKIDIGYQAIKNKEGV